MHRSKVFGRTFGMSEGKVVKRSDYVKSGVGYLAGAVLVVYAAVQLILIRKPDPFAGLTSTQTAFAMGGGWIVALAVGAFLLVCAFTYFGKARDVGPTLAAGIIVGIDPAMGLNGTTPRLQLHGYKIRTIGFEGWKLRRRIIRERLGWVIVSQDEYDEIKRQLSAPKHYHTQDSREPIAAKVRDQLRTEFARMAASSTLAIGKVYSSKAAPRKRYR